jgi:hypothetical protein
MRPLPQRLGIVLVFCDARPFPYNETTPSKKITRSELNRFAGILPTPCRCDGNPRRDKYCLFAKPAFATHTLSLQQWQSKHQGEFIH